MRSVGLDFGGVMRRVVILAAREAGRAGSLRTWVAQGVSVRYAIRHPSGSGMAEAGRRASGRSAGGVGRESLGWWWEEYPWLCRREVMWPERPLISVRKSTSGGGCEEQMARRSAIGAE